MPGPGCEITSEMTTADRARLVWITGAGKGIGRELARQGRGHGLRRATEVQGAAGQEGRDEAGHQSAADGAGGAQGGADNAAHCRAPASSLYD